MIFEQAFKAYKKYCNQNGFMFQKPDPKLSQINRQDTGKFIVLKNSKGTLTLVSFSNKGKCLGVFTKKDLYSSF
jgi:hypothetical protein